MNILNKYYTIFVKNIFNIFKYLLFFALIFTIATWWQNRNLISGTVPDFSITNLHGDKITKKDLDGEVYLIHFWADWCSICKFEINTIESISTGYPVLNIVHSPSSDINAFAKRYKMNPKNIYYDLNNNLFTKFGAKAVPTSFIVNSKGEIVFKSVGYSTKFGFRLRLLFANLI